MLNVLDLCAGIGGFSLALRPWGRTVAYCEKDRFCQAVLLSRMSQSCIDLAPIWDDLRTLRGWLIECPVDLIACGFPCQPYSTAARGRNKEDTVLKELIRVVREVRPTFVFAENVGDTPIRKAGDELEQIGYRVEYTTNTAAEVGAPHIGRRHWALATANGKSKPALHINAKMAFEPEIPENLWHDEEPKGLRVVDGLSLGMVRSRVMGNAVVPKQAREAFCELMEL